MKTLGADYAEEALTARIAGSGLGVISLSPFILYTIDMEMNESLYYAEIKLLTTVSYTHLLVLLQIINVVEPDIRSVL